MLRRGASAGQGTPWEDPSRSTLRCRPARRTRRRQAAAVRCGTGVTPTLLLHPTAAPASRGIPGRRRYLPWCRTGADRNDVLLSAIQQRAFAVSLNSELPIGQVWLMLKTRSPPPGPGEAPVGKAFPAGRHRLCRSLMGKLGQHAHGRVHLCPYPEGWKRTCE